jgi:hypothetical protein
VTIEYSLDIARDIEPELLLHLVEEELGLDHERDPECRSDRIPSLVGRDAPGFYLTALPVDQMNGQITEEWLGFRPWVRVMFRMDKEEDIRGAFLRVLRATSGVLARLPGDVALILNGEHVRVLRRGGRVIVKDDPRVWDAEALAEIRIPYELGHVPAP